MSQASGAKGKRKGGKPRRENAIDEGLKPSTPPPSLKRPAPGR